MNANKFKTGQVNTLLYEMDLWMLDISAKTRRKKTSEQAQRISLP